MDINEVTENPAFWILGGMGVGMELLGWIIGKKMGLGSFPLWQLLIIMLVTLVASAYFATRE